ncbi:MAG: abortive infection family protein [Thermoleophilia bacterium]
MKIPTLTDAIVQAIADLFDADRRPAHSDLDRLFARAGLQAGDPRQNNPSLMIGKRKRVLGVLTYALDNDRAAGARLVAQLLATIRGIGGFDPNSDDYVGAEVVRNARTAVRDQGYDLSDDGHLRPLSLEGLEGAELSDALGLYVRRARSGHQDAALVAGTGKDLLEAVARHVLVSERGSYDERMNFPMTLFHAFYVRDLATPPGDLLSAWEQKLDSDPRRRLEQTLYLVGLAVNKLRNAQGTGHGRPFMPAVTEREAKLAIESMGLVAELLLENGSQPESGRAVSS